VRIIGVKKSATVKKVNAVRSPNAVAEVKRRQPDLQCVRTSSALFGSLDHSGGSTRRLLGWHCGPSLVKTCSLLLPLLLLLLLPSLQVVEKEEGRK
jgi:hypothetical protein